MRHARVLLTVLLTAVLTGSITACESVQQASDAANEATDKASVCVKALQLAGFNPDLSDPQQAADEAQRTSEELAQLADQTPDESLKQALDSMSAKVGELQAADITAAGVASWTEDKVNTLNALTTACA